ncbi:uncharacterized protein HaLaN_06673 [Haematococcus lacustris]|uniref:WW domain-containing protein n=1 Tax=Haematococcus lacustris TaxID=44745 RepID=A0A699YVX7_HAELA|nr:uncharacterized protein HaLaN_06673 [Haematococcus lacustris]
MFGLCPSTLLTSTQLTGPLTLPLLGQEMWGREWRSSSSGTGPLTTSHITQPPGPSCSQSLAGCLGSTLPSCQNLISGRADGKPHKASPAVAGTVVVGRTPGLPPGWFEAVDPTYHHPYWFCPASGERSWVRPGEAALPQGWSMAVDPATQAHYYFNTASGERCWQRPSHPVPAPAAAAAGPRQAFVPATRFEGARPGYLFKSDALGLGYYLDNGPGAAQLWVAVVRGNGQGECVSSLHVYPHDGHVAGTPGIPEEPTATLGSRCFCSSSNIATIAVRTSICPVSEQPQSRAAWCIHALATGDCRTRPSAVTSSEPTDAVHTHATCCTATSRRAAALPLPRLCAAQQPALDCGPEVSPWAAALLWPQGGLGVRPGGPPSNITGATAVAWWSRLEVDKGGGGALAVFNRPQWLCRMSADKVLGVDVGCAGGGGRPGVTVTSTHLL